MGMKFTLVLDDIPTEWTRREIREHIQSGLIRVFRDIPWQDSLGVYTNLLDENDNIIGRYAVKNADGSIPRGV